MVLCSWGCSSCCFSAFLVVSSVLCGWLGVPCWSCSVGFSCSLPVPVRFGLRVWFWAALLACWLCGGWCSPFSVGCCSFGFAVLRCLFAVGFGCPLALLLGGLRFLLLAAAAFGGCAFLPRLFLLGWLWWVRRSLLLPSFPVGRVFCVLLGSVLRARPLVRRCCRLRRQATDKRNILCSG